MDHQSEVGAGHGRERLFVGSSKGVGDAKIVLCVSPAERETTGKKEIPDGKRRWMTPNVLEWRQVMARQSWRIGQGQRRRRTETHYGTGEPIEIPECELAADPEYPTLRMPELEGEGSANLLQGGDGTKGGQLGSRPDAAERSGVIRQQRQRQQRREQAAEHALIRRKHMDQSERSSVAHPRTPAPADASRSARHPRPMAMERAPAIDKRLNRYLHGMADGLADGFPLMICRAQRLVPCRMAFMLLGGSGCRNYRFE